MADIFTKSQIHAHPLKNRVIISFLLLFFMATVPAIVFSQEFDEQDYTSSRKAWKYMLKARDAFREAQLDAAFEYAGRASEEDTAFLLPYILKGDILADMGNLEEASFYYQKVTRIDPDFDPTIWFVLANLEFERENYRKAKSIYEVYLEKAALAPVQVKAVREAINTCVFRAKALENPHDINPKRFQGGINTGADEYVNSISTDGKELIFTRKEPDPDLKDRFRERVFLSMLEDSIWSDALEMDEFLNDFGNIGAVSFSPDGQYLFLTGCNAPGGFGSCDLYYTRKIGNKWDMPRNLGPAINTGSWESQPCLSSDGKTLYFASHRPGGKGSSDIWKSVLLPDGIWSRPVNLGGLINTSNAEMAPFIHQDGRTLYFSSKGHTGMGGFDLFVSRMDEYGIWTAPQNLGYPINTASDEINLIVGVEGRAGYTSIGSDLEDGKYDIYEIRIPDEFRPLPVTFFKGIVFDAKTNKPLEASFDLIDLKTGNSIVRSLSNPLNGEFLVCLPSNMEYALNVSRPGYLFFSGHFDLINNPDVTEPYIKDVPLMPIEAGSKVILKNIFFDTDTYTLKEESIIELKHIYRFLQDNPTVHIEISGHTDNVGTYGYNKTLSENRAKAVYEYLVSEGIDPIRLSYIGYAFEQPIESNDSEEGRALNRRTEFKVTDY